MPGSYCLLKGVFMSKHIWGYWDCQCGHTHIRGDVTECPGCGSPRLADTKFYVDTSVKEYVEDSQKNSNPNWICNYCNTQNASADQVCKQCGASREKDSQTYFNHGDSSSNKRMMQSSVIEQCNMTNNEQPASDKDVISSRIRAIPRQAKLAIIWTTLAVTLIALFAWLFIPVERHMTIESFSWQRSIAVEELRTFDESGWSLPTNARLQYTRSELHHNEKVVDHYATETRRVERKRITGYDERIVGYRDLGNGQFEEETVREPIYETYYETETYQEPVYRMEPVYMTKYYYEIDRWTKTRSVDTSDSGKSPYWGEVVLADKERRGTTSESYFINGHIEDEYKQFSINYEDWSRLSEGDTISFTTFRFGREILSMTA